MMRKRSLCSERKRVVTLAQAPGPVALASWQLPTTQRSEKRLPVGIAAPCEGNTAGKPWRPRPSADGWGRQPVRTGGVPFTQGAEWLREPAQRSPVGTARAAATSAASATAAIGMGWGGCTSTHSPAVLAGPFSSGRGVYVRR